MDLYALNDSSRVLDVGMEKVNKAHQDHNSYNILKCEVTMSMKGMANGKAGGWNELPIELFKALGDNEEILLLDLCNKMYVEGRWPKNFLDTIMMPLSKKFNARKCEECWTIPHLTCIKSVTKNSEQEVVQQIR
ncbi:uncharacterized protein LOC142326867 [Lycorma delicatula]|uniref:uncharacterized protein LOC142326867 n=1 Tax=Lycorma delicatula TaxID=130591 RepID=UPI003F511383